MRKKKVNKSKNVSKTRKQEKEKTTMLVHAKTNANQLNMNKCSRKADKSNIKTDINVGNGVEGDQKCCHQCAEKGKDRVIDCEKCGSNRYCVDCRTKWYPNVSEEEFVKACPVCRSKCSCNICLLGFLKGPVDDLQFAKVPDILNGDDANICNHNNGWLDDSDTAEISTDELKQEQFPNDVIDISSSGQSTSISKNDPVPLQTTDNVVDQEPDSFENSNETEGKYRGNAVGVAAKQLLQAIEHHYPNTFKWDRIDSTAFWPEVLKELYTVIKGFLETLAGDLSEDHISKLEQRLSGLKTIGLDLSWVDKRLDMVKKLKLEHGSLKQDLMVMEDSAQLLQEKMVEREKQYTKALEMLEKAQSEYDSAKKARDDKESELRQKFGDNYKLVLNGRLALGLFPWY